MKNMSEVFELPVMVDSDGDIDVGDEDWIHLQNHRQANAISHAINHVDALADTLEFILNSNWNIESERRNARNAGEKALAAYRGEK